MSRRFLDERSVMAHALDLARRGRGHVEPNPCVGAVVVDDQLQWLGEGFHQQYGGPHAEVVAIRSAGDRCRGATLFVTLEPCCHHGKTPPCAEAVIQAGFRRVYVATYDPAPHVNGGGLRQLQEAGLEVHVGLMQTEAQLLLAPFITRVTLARPHVHAKWAMSLDGKIATHTQASKWISSAESRGIVHELRGGMDAIIVGSRTAAADDPLLTVRPPGPRTPARVVFDSQCRLGRESRLVQTIDEAPVIVCTTPHAERARCERLRSQGVDVLEVPEAVAANSRAPAEPSAGHPRPDVAKALELLAEREMTNVLVEGGGKLFGAFFDADCIDEYHVFLAPVVLGGEDSPSPVEGRGLDAVPQGCPFRAVERRLLEHDLYIHAIR